MNFSDVFRKAWWISLVAITTLAGLYRIFINSFEQFDQFLFVLWFILVLLPLVSEVSLFGVSVKKEIEEAKRDIKHSISEIKNQINMQTVIQMPAPNPEPADKDELKEKIVSEAQELAEEESKVTATPEQVKMVMLSPSIPEQKISKSEKAKDREEKMTLVESLVFKYFQDIYADTSKKLVPHQKFENQEGDTKVIVDGLVQSDSHIEEIIEIRYLTEKSFRNVFYLVQNFLKKLRRLKILIPVRVVFVSEELNTSSAIEMHREMLKFKSIRKTMGGIPKISDQYFKISGGQLESVEIETE
ncbi:hypothetical protein IT407_04110 [Candidatus Uhrbacteria bacterium]|nr:hypothetical protein [Candidatus Uhrbacteria bacterium]